MYPWSEASFPEALLSSASLRSTSADSLPDGAREPLDFDCSPSQRSLPPTSPQSLPHGKSSEIVNPFADFSRGSKRRVSSGPKAATVQMSAVRSSSDASSTGSKHSSTESLFQNSLVPTHADGISGAASRNHPSQDSIFTSRRPPLLELGRQLRDSQVGSCESRGSSRQSFSSDVVAPTGFLLPSTLRPASLAE